MKRIMTLLFALLSATFATAQPHPVHLHGAAAVPVGNFGDDITGGSAVVGWAALAAADLVAEDSVVASALAVAAASSKPSMNKVDVWSVSNVES